jgi:hypothetical protein
MSQMSEQELRLFTDAVTRLRAEEATPVTAESSNGKRRPRPAMWRCWPGKYSWSRIGRDCRH